MEDMILQTKLQPPQIKGKILHRDRLLHLLNGNLDKKLILICADAGYGKTTLLALCCAKFDKPFVFYSLDASDNDIAVFFNYLVSGIQRYFRDFGQRTKSIILQTRNIEILVGTFINEFGEHSSRSTLSLKGIGIKGEHEFYLILDDYQHLQQNREISNALDYLLRHLPANLHLIISSRSTPPLNLPYYFAKQELFKLEKDQLQFDLKEIQDLLKEVYALKISDPEIGRIEEHSEGWITAIQLILQKISTSGEDKAKDTLNGYIASGEEIFNYFAGEVFENQSQDIQKFLIKTSILEYLNPEICDHTLDIENSDEMLSFLKNEHIFLSYFQESSYQYHPLFKDFLSQKCKKETDEHQINAMHLRAGDYFLKTGNYESAIRHYKDINEYRKVAQIVEKIGEDVIEKGKYDTVKNWLSMLPDTLIEKQPNLLFIKGEIARWQGRLDVADAIYLKAGRFFRRKKDKKGLATSLYGRCLISLNRGKHSLGLRAARSAYKLISGSHLNKLKTRILNLTGIFYEYTGNYENGITSFNQALRLVAGTDDLRLEMTLMNNLGSLYDLIGDFSKALELYGKAIKIYQYRKIQGVCTSYRNVASIMVEMGDYKKAESYLQEAYKLAHDFNDEKELLSVKLIQAELLSQLNKKSRAIELRREALELCQKMAQDNLCFEILTALADDYRSIKNYLKAEECLSELSVSIPTREKDIAYANFLVSKGLVARDTKRIRSAIRAINEALKIYIKFKAQYETIQAYFYLADCFLRSKNIKKFKENFSSVLILACEKKYDRFIVDQSESSHLLSFALEKQVGPMDYVKKLYDQLKQPQEELIKLPSEAREADLAALLFGKFDLFHKGNAVQEKNWRTRSLQAIFIFFLINQSKKFTKDELFDKFWPKLGPRSASMNLRSALYHIRATIAEMSGIPPLKVIIFKDQKYFLNQEFKIWIDAVEFDERIKEAKVLESQGKSEESISQYTKAINRYRAPFLEEFYEDWIEELRRYHQEGHLRALSAIALKNFEHKDYAGAIDISQKILSINPFLENIHLLLIKCFSALKNKNAVVSQYKKLKTLLREELELTPSQEIELEYRRLLS